MQLIPNSSPREQYNVSSLIDILRYRALHQSDQVAYTFVQRGETELSRLTYQELDQKARSIAAQLQNLGSHNSRALLLYPPSLEFITAFFGCLYAGVVAVPAYPPPRNQKISMLQAIVTDAQAKFALTTTLELAKVESQFVKHRELTQLHWLVTDKLTNEPASDWQEQTFSDSNLAFLQYTSGSTAKPKGVMVSHGNLLHNSKLIHQCFRHTANSQGVIWLPPYHDMGLIGGVVQPLYGGFPVALMSPIDFLKQPFCWLQAISRYRATTSGGPNFAYDLCVNKITPEQISSLDLSKWEVAFTGAEPVRADTIERFAAYFKSCGFRREAFYPCYGMAETTLIASGSLKTSLPIICRVQEVALEQNCVAITDSSRENTRLLVSCGQNLPDQKIVIVNPKSLTQCQADQVGEIWVSSSSVAQGYWNRIEETRQAFHAYLADTGEGPFLRTGDLGFLQGDELFITGRLKDVIIIRGKNYYPQDIELTIENCHPALRANCGAVFSVEINGAEQLVTVQEVQRSYLRKLDANEIVGNIRQAVTTQHALQLYAAVLVKPGSIPKTSSGKIQRNACRAKFLAGDLNVVIDWSENPRYKTAFINLQSELELTLQQLSKVQK
ncbi:AMP-dependent synthetase and ligase [Rivularia sp. IAM M-261]|nr:AMP-dependent synthetase and ligase [Rivularia sp. IAM M-261]